MGKDSSKSFFKSVVIFVVCLLIFLNFPYVCETHAHSHEHDHDHVHHHHDDHAHHDHHHRQGETPSFKYSREANVKYEEDVKFADNSHVSKDRFTLWAQAIGSTVLISAAPFLILFLVPLDNTKEREPLLKILLSFASGSLLGDAFLHLIPHAISPHSHDDSAEHSHGHSHSHDHGAEPHSHDMRVGFWVLFGIIAFLMVEKFVRLVKGGHSHSHSHGDTKHAENQHKKKVNEKSEVDDSDNSKKKVKKGDKKEITESSQEVK
ncbi:hypothetical protein R5R35_007020 [Gryllus longicercus]|uniref:Uncharacterized protein n=1 Tax=Gryllus longicercus TaxID=2509291 RepID=A0AAN9ZGC2_9ORTH